ncbi:vesicular integral-membrane protein vip36 [Stylonychia lemnae]|uniref:Vesicular integral-membrane protein vip36 n=1 Tax=Stylonychia lemnae TaxID=5949 RepID=A0A077ZXN8_STYLE|nr:vesicular integral-membrane protein vip36 [Stylonychia lemnae]|eukprot:CDW73997.1 vesicular integral-membrane protein vip36 [Stylonychia lemnae]
MKAQFLIIPVLFYGLISEGLAQEIIQEDLPLQVSHDHYLDFPLSKRDFANWRALGTTVIHKNKVVIVPQSKEAKGMFYTAHTNPFPQAWIADIEINIGNTAQTFRPGSILGIYYVRDVDLTIHQDQQAEYSKMFNGLGIFLNTLHHNQTADRKLAQSISMIVSDGRKIQTPINWKNVCFRKYKNQPENSYFKMRLKFEMNLITLSTYDIQTKEFEQCVQQPIDDSFAFNGYFLFGGSSGLKTQDHIYLRSFKLYAAHNIAENQHFQQARKTKATYLETKQLYQEALKNIFNQLKKNEIDDSNHQNLTQLYNLIPVTHMNLTHSLERVVTFEDLIQQRYMHIVHSVIKKPDFTQLMEKVYLFKNTLNVLSYDLDQQSFKIIYLEKELKRVRFHQDMANSVTQRELNNKQISDLSKVLASIKDAMVKMQRGNDELVYTLSRLEKSVYNEIDTTDNLYVKAKSDRHQAISGQVFYDMREVDEIFDHLEDHGVGKSSAWNSLLNYGMMMVIGASIYIWCQLNKYENRFK